MNAQTAGQLRSAVAVGEFGKLFRLVHCSFGRVHLLSPSPFDITGHLVPGCDNKTPMKQVLITECIVVEPTAINRNITMI